MRRGRLALWVMLVCAFSATGAFTLAGMRAARAPAVTTVEETIEETVLSARAGITYDVEMTESTSVWPEGSHLEPDRVLYTYAGAPVLHLRPYLDVSGPYPGQVTAQSLLAMDLSGATSLGVPLWRKPVRPPKSKEMDELLPGDSVTVRLEGPDEAIAVMEARDEARQIHDELGFVRAVDGITITYTVTVRATIDGREYELPLQVVLPVHLQEDGFAPGPQEKAVQAAQANGKRVQAKQVAVGFLPRLLRQYPWIGSGVLLMMAGGVMLYNRRPRQQPDSLLLPEHRRFKDWITIGKVGPYDGVSVEVLSLEGLVDLAIDMNKRVILDRDRACYVVVDQAAVYIYRKTEADEHK